MTMVYLIANGPVTVKRFLIYFLTWGIFTDFARFFAVELHVFGVFTFAIPFFCPIFAILVVVNTLFG